MSGGHQAALAQVEPFEDRRAIFAQQLAAGADLDALDGVNCALRGGVKEAQALHLVAEEVDAHRLAQVGRPDVDDAAAAGKGPRLFDDLDRVIAGLHPTGDQLFQAHRRAAFDRAQCQAQLAGGQRLLHQGTRAGDHNRRGRGASLQDGQRAEPPLARGAAPRDALVGHGVGVGKVIDGCAALFKRRQPSEQLLAHLLRHFAARRDEQDGGGPVSGQGGHQTGARRRQHSLRPCFLCTLQLGQPFGKGGHTGQQIDQPLEFHAVTSRKQRRVLRRYR